LITPFHELCPLFKSYDFIVNLKPEIIIISHQALIVKYMYSFCKVDQPAKMKPTAKHPFKVHIWARISTKGITLILIFSRIMDRLFYVEEMQGKTLLPFLIPNPV